MRVGIPVLTLKGNSFASRVAASLLNTINLNELIVTNIEDYKKLAIKIYNEKNYLDEIKKKLLSIKRIQIYLKLKFIQKILKEPIKKYIKIILKE